MPRDDRNRRRRNSRAERQAHKRVETPRTSPQETQNETPKVKKRQPQKPKVQTQPVQQTRTVSNQRTSQSRGQRQTHKQFSATRTPSVSRAERQVPVRTRNTESRNRNQRQAHKVYGSSRTEEGREARRVLRNVGESAKRGLSEAYEGWKATAKELPELAGVAGKDDASLKVQAMRMGKNPNDRKTIDRLRAIRTEESEQRKAERNEVIAKQQKERKAFEEKTKNASGFEKALYGAAESGAGMAADIGVGAALGALTGGSASLLSLGAMGARTYGNTRGQAEQEGATESEDRRNAILQAAKEVGTESIFRGVGLAKGFASKSALSFGDRVANALTSKMTGKAADVVGAGARLGSGVAEENIEEILGWAADPVISEVAYKGNVRKRKKEQVQAQLKDESDALRAQVQDEQSARAMAAYLSSEDFINQNAKAYQETGMSEKKSLKMAEQMRDYLTASLVGDTESMEKLEEEMSASIAGKGLSKKSWSLSELGETVASTTMLTAATGLPGTVQSAYQGATLKEQLGDKGIEALAKTAVNFDDAEASEKAQVMADRIAQGKGITDTQAFDLGQAMIRQNEKDAQRVDASRNSAYRTIESENLVSPFMEMEDGSLELGRATAQTMGANIKTAETAIKAINHEAEGDVKLSVSQVREGADAIASFQSGIMTIDDINALTYTNKTVRTAFEEVTGIDLGQYEVKKKNGEIDIAATNAKTKDALFVLASENLVETARAETVEWKDNTKGQIVTDISARMGSGGTLALQTALDDVDERDRRSYMLTANATDLVYQSARNMGTEWDTVKDNYTTMFPEISESKLRSMYEAGLADRAAAEDTARGRAVEIGKSLSDTGEQETATGQVFVETKEPPKGTVIRLFSELANNLGSDIHLVDHLGTAVGEANGAYDPNTNTFYINVNNAPETNLGYIFMHEVTHYLRVHAPEEYLALENLVREKWFQADSGAMQNAIAKKIAQYSSEQNLTEDQALEEIIADSAHEFLNDPNFAKQVAEENPTLAKAMVDAIKRVLRILRRMFLVDGIDDTQMDSLYSQLDIMTEAEALWLDAYKTAVRNRGNAAIDEMQDRMVRESISDSENESFVTLSPQRIDSLIEEYAIPGNADSDYSKAWIATINPRDFLKLTVKDETLDTWEVGTTNEWGQEVRNLDREDLQNTRLMPFLKIDTSESHSVIGHEGRHRMLALYRAGYTEVPVVIQDINEATKNNKIPMEDMDGEGADLWPQDFGDGAVNGDVSIEVYDTIPINEKNRAEIERVYGSTSEDQVRFSLSDQSYMDAVNKGDMETAQRMVDDAARRAGYDVKAYHQTAGDFTVFNTDNPQAGRNDSETPNGIFFKTNDHDIGLDGKKQIPVYLRTGRSLSFANREEANKWYRRNVRGYEDLDKTKDKEVGALDERMNALEDLMFGDGVTDEEYDALNREWDALLEQMHSIEDGHRGKLRELLNDHFLSGDSEYDSIHLGYDGHRYVNGKREDVETYIVFGSDQAKLADPVTYDEDGDVIPLSERFDTWNQDIRYSVTTEKNAMPKGGSIPDSLKKWAKDIGLDTISDQPVKAPVQISVRNLRYAWYEKNGRTEEAKNVDKVLNAVGDTLTNLIGKYNYIDLEDAVNATVHYRTDADGNPLSVILSCQVKNAEYEVNYDFTTICKKRSPMQKVLERFIKTEGESKDSLYDELNLDEEGMYKLRLILEQAGFEVSCPACFVEQNRYAQQKQANDVADDWNKALDEWAKDNGVEITENFDLVNLDINTIDYEEVERAFAKYHELMKGVSPTVANKNRALIESSPIFRKRMRASDYASIKGQRALMAFGESKKKGTNLYGLLKRGQGDSKQSVPFVAYNGEVSLLPDKMKGKSLVDYLYSVGGARGQSASDFQIEYIYDYMQLVADLAGRFLPAHMYTKEVDEVELLGMTGIKFNMSAMCDVDESVDPEYAGLKLVDGEYEYNISNQSVDYDRAVELQRREGYTKNVGIIMVTLSHNHMLKALDDNDIRFIIGYHSSKMPPVVARMSNMGGAEDFTGINKTKKLNDKGKVLFDEAMKEASGKTELDKFKDALRIFDEKIQANKKSGTRRGNEYGAFLSSYKNNTADFDTYGDVAKTKDARKTADNYLEYCMKNDLIPMYFPYAFHENYYKAEIFDFNMYDNMTGESALQEAVRNIYPGMNIEEGQTDPTEFMNRVSEMMNAQNKINKRQNSKYDEVVEQAKNELRLSITGNDYIDFDETGIDRTELTHRADALKAEAQVRDESYMDAVESGNMDEAQRLVDEAAKEAGYGTEVWHGSWTDSPFTVFDPSSGGRTNKPGWNWVTTDEEYTKEYTSYENPLVMHGYINTDGALSLGNIEVNAYSDSSSGIKYNKPFKKLAEKVGMTPDDLYKAVNNDYSDYGEVDFDVIGDRFADPFASVARIPMFAITASGAFREAAEAAGYNIVKAKEGNGTTTYGLANSSQFKSSDPVTYAEDGSVIPLSERFDPSNLDIRYSITPEDDAIEWLASQYDLDDIPLEDEVAEEGRVRMRKSKEDFIASKTNEWNERWLTNGKVLDVEDASLKRNVKSLVMGVMANSDTNRQYKTELVDDLLIASRSAYWMIKDGREGDAADLIWNTAVKMIEDVDFIDDSTFNQYKGLRDYLRQTPLSLGEDYWQDVNYNEFRKRNRGRIKMVKGDTNIDSVYLELQEKWPEWFDEKEQLSIPDQLMHIEQVLNGIQPYKYAYTSEEAQDIATDIASELYDIICSGKAYKSIADTYKARYDAKTKALKARHKEALRKVREQGDLKVLREKAKWTVREEKRKTAREHAKYFGKIDANLKWLTDRLINETKDKNIPEPFRRSLAHLLMQFDMQTERSKKLEEKYGVSQKQLRIRELKDRLSQIAKEDDTGEFEYNGYLFMLMDALAEKVDGKTIDALDVEDLMAIDTMLKAIRHNFQNYQKVILEGKRVEMASIGDKTIEAMDTHIEKYGKRKTRSGFVGAFDKLLNEGEETPIYLFERLDPTGEGIGAMYKELRRGEDKHIRNMAFLRDRFSEMFGSYFNKGKNPGSELEKWRDSSREQTFNLQNGSITLNPSQIMSLYCLSKRPQALGHILGAGIVSSPSRSQKLRERVFGKSEQVDSVMVTYEEVQQIISTLTKEQVKLAEEMQSLMNNEMAAWGNEASLQLHGIRLFREKNYFPIKTSGEVLTKTADSFENNAAEKIKNFGFTKPLVRNANNAIMLDDIFSVTADHCNKMSLYNAMAVPISDFMRVYNYKQKREDGSEKTVQQAIGEAFTRSVNQYIMKFISDVNSNTKTRSDAVDDLFNKTLANYKKASIGANFRVALQQPTAIFRAFMEISPKYFVGVMPTPKAVAEMKEHCPIALWKSWGHYDMDMGRDVEDIMMNRDWSKWDTITMGIYGGLDNATWSMIWQAVKREVQATHPDVKVGSKEFFDICNERASEIFDKTQVVDSIFHRSDTMRSKNTLTKMMVSFMAEPTLTYNVLRNTLVNTVELMRDGNYVEAAKKWHKMGVVLALNAAAVSASAAIWDAVRGKGADDDDDDKKLSELWFQNFIENLKDNANILNNIYFVKDIKDIKENIENGFGGTSNMALEGFSTFFTGMAQMKKKLEEGSDKSWYDIFMNVGGGVGYITGIPIKTIMRDARAIVQKLGIPVFADDGSVHGEEEFTSLIDKAKGFLPSREDSGAESDIDSKVSNYRNGLSDEYTDDQKKKLTKQYEKSLMESTGMTEKKPEEDFDYQMEMRSLKATEKATGKTGVEKDEVLWDVISDGYSKYIEDGDMKSIQVMKDVYMTHGGNEAYFDNKVVTKMQSIYKKTIFSETESDEENLQKQDMMRRYMLDHGVTAEELSEMCYKTYTASDLKAALRMGNEKYIMDELIPLVRAGLSRDDFEKLVKYQNYGAKTYDGKYSDPKYRQSTGNLVWPTQGQITSEFGYRNAPTAGASSNHPAIDIGASQGSPVVAADGGKVISAGNAGGYGNQVAIQHDNGMVTYYSHLYSWNVKVGDTVAQGQQVGQVGSTGISTGPHLDFKVEVNGEPVNPLKYLSR